MNCSICGGQMVKKVLDIDKTWKGRTVTFRGIEADVCKSCGVKVYEASDVAMMESLIESTLDQADYPEVMNVEEVSRFLRVTPQTVYNMLRDGRLAAAKIGREWRFAKEAVAALIGMPEPELAREALAEYSVQMANTKRTKQHEAKTAGMSDYLILITPEQIDDVVRRVVDSLQPEKVILFGSYANGTPTINSDLDLLAIKETDLPRHERGCEARKALRGLKIPVDLLVYTPQEIKASTADGSFIGRVAVEGKVLYE